MFYLETAYEDLSADIDVLDGWNDGESPLYFSSTSYCTQVTMRMAEKVHRKIPSQITETHDIFN